jgi:hypothetical protein
MLDPGVVASFMLDPVNNGVGASFQLELENSRSCSFLQVGACKSGGWSLLPFGAGEFRELELPSCSSL